MDRKAQIIEYINNNLGEHLTLEGLCEHFHTNRTTLARLIKEATGKSPIRYILEERLRRSRAELEEGELSVSEVAEKYGFSDDNYFIRAFKKQYGVSPLKFRKRTVKSTDTTLNSMSINEFELYIRQGFGRAVLMLKKQPHKEHFIASVINNAVYDPRYDTQVNDNRGHYIKELIDCFDNSEELYDEILKAYSCEGHPEVVYHIGNLRQWAESGCQKAKATLLRVYENCYNNMLKVSFRAGLSVDPVCDAYRYAAQSLHTVDENMLSRLLNDGIKLIKYSNRYDMNDFIDFFDDIIAVSHKTMMSALVELAEKDKVVKFFYDSYCEKHRIRTEKFYELNRGKPIGLDMTGVKSWRDVIDLCITEGNPRLSNMSIKNIWQSADENDRQEIAKALVGESDIRRRSVLMWQLAVNGMDILLNYPVDASPLICELESESKKDLRAAGMGSEYHLRHRLGLLISRIRRPEVRSWAMKRLAETSNQGGDLKYAFGAFLTNYTEADAPLLCDFVFSVWDKELIHSMSWELTQAVSRILGGVPDDVLYRLYELTPCTNCRGNLANILIEYHGKEWNPEARYISMVRELCYDSDEPNRVIGKRAAEQLDLRLAHNKCKNHRRELEWDRLCGCFYCKEIYSPSEITTWIDGGSTALCPRCGIDSVIGESSGYPITLDFLSRMNERWFGMSGNPDFESFVSDVLGRVIAEDKKLEPLLKKQLESAEVRRVEHFKRGFSVEYNVFDTENKIRKGKSNSTLGKLRIQIDGLERGMGFVLFIRDGLISAFEGYTYEEDLPSKWWEKRSIKPFEGKYFGKGYVASLRGYERLFESAVAALDAYPQKEYYTEATSLLTEEGKVITFVTKNAVEDGPDPEFFDELRKKGDTRIVRMLSMWVNGGVDMGSFRIRRAVLDLDPRNYTAEVIATGAVSFVRKPLWITMPPGWWENRCRTQAEIASDHLGGAEIKVERLKKLIKTAETDMDSHPAFPQENIKYEAVAIETSKGNIYHAVLDVERKDEDMLIHRMKKNEDTHIITYVSMPRKGYSDIGSYYLRYKLRNLDPRNSDATLWESADIGYIRKTLKEVMPWYSSKNKLEDFEFHDAVLGLKKFFRGDLYLSAKDLNIHKNTEQNQKNADMKIKDATIIFRGFDMISLDAEAHCEGTKKFYVGDKGREFFFKCLDEPYFTVLDLDKGERGTYTMNADNRNWCFTLKFSFDAVIINWDEYEGKAWYEFAEWPWKKREQQDN
ncbi:MAG: helix-turn-helix transcriptional regulator [Clostridia bacterium]|nr:helix-turn-helix transcriptional regulator [Clostridia bacterium]